MRTARAVAAASVVLLLAAECGDDDAAAPSTAGGGDVLDFCLAYMEAGSTLSAATAGEGGEGVVPPQLDQALTEAEELAPAEVEDEVGDVARQVREAFESGDTTPLEDPEFTTLDDGVDQFVAEDCADETVDATGIDYAFEGVPGELGSGVVAFTFANQGEELHELALFRINANVDATLEELLNDPEGQSQIEEAGHLFAVPGASDTESFDLEAGRYGYVCFIPVGLTPGAAESGEEPAGPAHFTEGMFGEITVS